MGDTKHGMDAMGSLPHPHAIQEQTDSSSHPVGDITTAEENFGPRSPGDPAPSSPNSPGEEKLPLYIYRRYADTEKSEFTRRIGSMDLEAQSCLTHFEKDRFSKHGSFIVLDGKTPEEREEVDRQLNELQEMLGGKPLVNDVI